MDINGTRETSTESRDRTLSRLRLWIPSFAAPLPLPLLFLGWFLGLLGPGQKGSKRVKKGHFHNIPKLCLHVPFFGWKHTKEGVASGYPEDQAVVLVSSMSLETRRTCFSAFSPKFFQFFPHSQKTTANMETTQCALPWRSCIADGTSTNTRTVRRQRIRAISVTWHKPPRDTNHHVTQTTT